MHVVLVAQKVILAFELSAAKRAIVLGQHTAALAQVPRQGVRPRVTPAAFMTREGRVVVDAAVLPLGF